MVAKVLELVNAAKDSWQNPSPLTAPLDITEKRG